MTSFCVCKRARLLDNTERLERSTHKLEQGYRIAVETGKDITPPPPFFSFLFSLFLCVYMCVNHSALVKGGRAQELCENWGGCPGLLVPKSHYGLCVHKAIFEEEVRRGSPVLDQMMHQVRLQWHWAGPTGFSNNNNNNNRELTECFLNLKALYNLKKNIQCLNTHNYGLLFLCI